MIVFTVEEIIDLGNKVIAVFDSQEKAKFVFEEKQRIHEAALEAWYKKNEMILRVNDTKARIGYEIHKYEVL
jgi:hypothetical protein